jgi:hypothetical protein
LPTALPGAAKHTLACRRSLTRLPACVGMVHGSSVFETNRYRGLRDEDSVVKASARRGLYPGLNRARARTGLQLAPCPIRCLASLHSQSNTRRVGHCCEVSMMMAASPEATPTGRNAAGAFSWLGRLGLPSRQQAGARLRLFRGRAGETGGGQATHRDEGPRHRRRNRQSAGAVECPWNLEQRAPGFGDGLRRLPALTNRSRGVRRTQFPFGIRSFNNFRFLGRNRTASY